LIVVPDGRNQVQSIAQRNNHYTRWKSVRKQIVVIKYGQNEQGQSSGTEPGIHNLGPRTGLRRDDKYEKLASLIKPEAEHEIPCKQNEGNACCAQQIQIMITAYFDENAT
jgi:hypothetical protein